MVQLNICIILLCPIVTSMKKEEKASKGQAHISGLQMYSKLNIINYGLCSL